MGWSFRRSVKLGPLRVNLSRSGVSLSGGVRGARVNVGPRGTYVSLGAGGFSYRRKIGGSNRTAARVARSDAPPSGLDRATDPSGDISTASVSALQSASPHETMTEISRQLGRTNWFAVYAVVAGMGIVGALATSPTAATLAAVVAVGLAIPIYRWSDDRRTARLIYDVDDAQLVERLALAAAAGEALGRSTRLWHIWWSRPTHDQKRNAGASHLIQRTVVRSQPGSLSHIEANIEPWCVPIGPQRLLFLPDMLLVGEGRRFAGVAYEELTVRAGSTQFIETEGVPRDSQIVGTTWKYVNKSGGPDRRFNNNRQLQVARYGELILEAAGGLRVVLNTSNAESAESAARALGELGQPDRTPAPTEPARPRAAQASAAARSADSVAEVLRDGDSGPAQAFAFAVLLKYIAAADRRMMEEERRAMTDALAAHVGGDATLLNSVSARVESIKPDSASVAAALGVLARLDPPVRKEMLDAAWSIARADGKVTPKEVERLKELGVGLAVEMPAVSG